MADANQAFKIITIRLPEEFWDRAKIAAHTQRTSLQAVAVAGIASVLGIEPPEEAEATAEVA